MSSRIFISFIVTTSWLQAVGDPAFTPAQIESFEKTIRPLLVERCTDCHGAHKHENGLRLDSRAAILRGSDYGKVVEAGKPQASKLIHAVRGTNGVEPMPKKGDPLSAPEIAALERWIAEGLPWPEEQATAETHGKADPKTHWAFQPIVKPSLPAGAAPANAIDALLSVRLRDAGLDFAPEADPALLIRRLHLTLTGLQPDYQEVKEFVSNYAYDPAGTWERSLNRLLASPQYGQKWARHWLDVARYSDTEGYQAGGKDIRFPHAYTYRNWVIDALNEDLPYDEFVLRQIAADRLLPQDVLAKALSGSEPPPHPELRHLAALGFLTVNDRFLGDRLLQTDDRIDVVTRGLLGLTVGCARCHDHKFDPVTSKDYYALYGVFNSSDSPDDAVKPMIGRPMDASAVSTYQAQVAEVENRKQALREEVLLDLRERDKLRDYLVFAQRHLHTESSAFRGTAGKEMMRDRIADSWRQFIKWSVESAKVHPVMYAWKRFSELPEQDFSGKAPELIQQLTAAKDTCNSVVAAAFAQAPAPQSFSDVAAVYASVFLENSGVEPYGDKQRESIRALIRGGRSPMTIDSERVEGYFTRKDREKMTRLENEIKKLDIESPGAPHRAMVMLDRDKPADQRIMIRGNPGRLGEPAPRAYLEFFGGEKFTDGSGRLELARKIASSDNPLTARVLVNRVWMQHFGKPLVSQPSDFGVQTPRPVQAELLDYLAAEFMESGWSLKKLHHRILSSRAWRQSSAVTPEKALKDAENDLISRQNRQRMDYEVLRDNLLLAAGRLNPALNPARSVPHNAPDAEYWRSVLLFVDRYDQPTVPAMFDFANPDSHSPQRFVTTVPQQALFLMNSPFMKSQAERLAGQTAPHLKAEAQVVELYRRVLLRDPLPEEASLAARFLADANAEESNNKAEFLWDYGTLAIQADANGRYQAGEFKPFQHLDRKSLRWTPEPTYPHPQWAYAALSRSGGHSGSGAIAPAARWTSPRSLTTQLQGQVKRPSTEGDGIRVFVVSDRQGVLHDQLVAPGKTERIQLTVTLSAGETLSLAFGGEATTNHDSFDWKLTLHEEDRLLTDAARDFCGPDRWPLDRDRPQTPLAQLAQVLLMANEFQFVD